jgi:hypothetical protein
MKRAAVLILSLAAGPAFAQTPPPATPAPAAAPPQGCDSPESGQFDFWVGRWEVYPTGSSQKVADSVIERLYMGCAVRENWMPLDGNGGPGGSLNSYVAAERQWRQTWVGSGGERVEFTGGWNGTAMVLTGPRYGARPGRLTRMTFTPNAAERSVRQVGEISTDGGATWTAAYDFTYRKAAG